MPTLKKTNWKPGTSGNPKGRPAGSKNQSTLAALMLLEGEAEGIARVAVEAARAGDMVAVRLVMDKLIPSARERHVTVKLPDVSTAEGISKASRAVLKAVADGELLPSEGQTMAALIEALRKSHETVELARRIDVLEGKQNAET